MNNSVPSGVPDAGSSPLQIAGAVLHHIGLLTRNIEREAEKLQRLFGYMAESGVIEDPVQTAYVMFLRLPGSEFWLELIAPNGENSKLANAARKGGGLNHLCYEVRDIDGACTVLRDNGFFLLAEPTPAVAFPGRRIAWLMDAGQNPVELVEYGDGPLCAGSLRRGSAATTEDK